MTESSSNLEAAAKELGIEIADNPNQFVSEPVSSEAEQNDETQDGAQESVQEPVEYTEQETAFEQAEWETAFEQEIVEATQVDQADESSLNDEYEPSQEELDSLVVKYMSEKLGVNDLDLDTLESFLKSEPKEPQFEVDERIKPILDFVEKTGRSPEDWFRYQQLNPSEMDDLSAVRLSLQTEYPDLTGNEVQRLLNNKYKIDPDRFDAEEIADAQLQLKIDATRARKDISSLREGYNLPMEKGSAQEEIGSPFDDAWYSSMRSETEAFDNLEFELPNGASWKYGVRDDYKRQLINKNSRLEEFFDQYVNTDGSWDYDTLNAHRTLVDNIDEIVSNVYKQGLGEGLKKIVDTASNVQAEAPSSTPQKGGDMDAQTERLLRELGGTGNMMRVKF